MIVAALVAGTVGAFAAAQPAAAGHNNQYAQQTSLRYTDSRDVHASNTPDGDIPVGAWRDANGTQHISRVYAAFDISSFASKKLYTATLFTRESQATDCADRAIQVWKTAPATNPTWVKPPAELALAGTIGTTTACPANLQLDLTSLVQQALAAGQSTLSLELRVPAHDEGKLDLGRFLSGYYGVTLSVNYDSLPAQPTKLYNAGQACVDQAPGPYLAMRPAFAGPVLSALFQDADSNDRLTASFAVWPVDHPDQRTVFNANAAVSGHWSSAQVPAGALADNTAYAWQATLNDDSETSAPSTTCYFTTDATAPGQPTVSSSNYPESTFVDGGTPAHFTFDANGAPDVAGFQYSWNDLSVNCGYTTSPDGEPQWRDPYTLPGMVRADALGGSATVDLSPPNAGPNRLYVQSVDRACNVSEEFTYEVYVNDTSPTITASGTPAVGQPLTLTLTPNPAVTQVLNYTYQVNNSATQTVAAQPDGSATITVTPQNYGQFTVQAASHSANGWVSPLARYSTSLTNAPTVTSDIYPDYFATNESGGGVGVTGHFTFDSPLSGIAGYQYWIDWNESFTVPVGPDGTATVSYTPDYDGLHELDVFAVDQNGSVVSDPGTYYFNVNSD
ncbi:hypothetical protein Raf01_87860 [Rugosimonospora africana]|uniref:DNRLRE domain-containing protein n=2 Tax=Rugosimonospora africana TaxID=556532 RepID=A0A8J3R095_9ACTN|nr:hypothetical protein Raf01_87860 [Rugosimonospora africana]